MADLKLLRKPTPVKRHDSDRRGLLRISAAAADAVDNPESVRDWDDEELRRGRRKDRNGRFTGRDPVVVPTNCYREMMRREFARANQLMGENLVAAAQALTRIIESPASEDKDVIKAAQLLLDRVMGKNPEKLDVSFKTPMFIGVLNGIVPGPELERYEGAVIDVDGEEVVWDDD